MDYVGFYVAWYRFLQLRNVTTNFFIVLHILLVKISQLGAGFICVGLVQESTGYPVFRRVSKLIKIVVFEQIIKLKIN